MLLSQKISLRLENSWPAAKKVSFIRLNRRNYRNAKPGTLAYCQNVLNLKKLDEKWSRVWGILNLTNDPIGHPVQRYESRTNYPVVHACETPVPYAKSIRLVRDIVQGTLTSMGLNLRDCHSMIIPGKPVSNVVDLSFPCRVCYDSKNVCRDVLLFHVLRHIADASSVLFLNSAQFRNLLDNPIPFFQAIWQLSRQAGVSVSPYRSQGFLRIPEIPELELLLSEDLSLYHVSLDTVFRLHELLSPAMSFDIKDPNIFRCISATNLLSYIYTLQSLLIALNRVIPTVQRNIEHRRVVLPSVYFFSISVLLRSLAPLFPALSEECWSRLYICTRFPDPRQIYWRRTQSNLARYSFSARNGGPPASILIHEFPQRDPETRTKVKNLMEEKTCQSRMSRGKRKSSVGRQVSTPLDLVLPSGDLYCS